MVQAKKPVASKKAASSASARRAVPKAATKRVSSGRKLAARDAPHVSVITAGGYTVFGSPVQPAHLTTEQIAQAIAELD